MIFDLFFLILFFIFPVLWYLMSRHFNVKLLKINIISILFFSIIVFQYIGLPILYFKLDPYRILDVTDKWIMFRVFLYTSISTTLLLLGSFVFTRTNLNFKNFKTQKKTSNYQNFLFTIIFLFSSYVLYKFVDNVGFYNLALSSVLGLSDNLNLTLIRSDMSNAFDGYGWYYLFMNKVLIFTNLFFYADYLINQSFKSKILFYVSSTVCVFSLIIGTEKAPLIYYLISLFLVYSILKKNSIISKNIILKIAPIFLLIRTVFYIFFMDVSGIDNAIKSVFSRALNGTIQPAYHYLEFFPKVEPFLLGRSMTNPGGILPFENFNLTQEVMSWYNSREFKAGIVGSMPTIYWGEIFANFGTIGVLVIPFFLGFFLSLIDSTIKRFENNSITIAFYVWIIIHYQYLSVTSFTNYFFDLYLSVVFLIYIMTMLSGKKFKLIFYRN